MEIMKIWLSDVSGGKPIPIAVQNCYGRSRFEGYLGNVGLDDKSDIRTAIALYEKLITEERIDLVLGPYGSRMTDPVRQKTFPMTAKFG